MSIPAAVFKAECLRLMDEVASTGRPIVITKHGKPAAVVVSIDDLASLEETLEVAGRPQLMQQIRDSLAELDQAQIMTKDELLAELRR